MTPNNRMISPLMRRGRTTCGPIDPATRRAGLNSDACIRTGTTSRTVHDWLERGLMLSLLSITDLRRVRRGEVVYLRL